MIWFCWGILINMHTLLLCTAVLNTFENSRYFAYNILSNGLKHYSTTTLQLTKLVSHYKCSLSVLVVLIHWHYLANQFFDFTVNRI